MNSDEKEVGVIADYLFSRRDVGFGFDYSPEIAKGRIITLKESEDLKSINCKDYNNTFKENKLIIGDNYNALKALLLTHKNKIDVIYIDPPYNTEKMKDDGNNISSKDGKNSGKFCYKDKFGRTGWLSMIKDRLLLAKDLLTDEGVIFVSIDDGEQAYLKVLMDDIFGEENFVGMISWNRKTSKSNVKIMSKIIDYVLVYCIDKKNIHKAWYIKDLTKTTLLNQINNSKSLIKKKEILNEFFKKHDVTWKGYINIDDNGIYRTDAMSNRFNTGGHYYKIINPLNNHYIEPPKQGWLWKEETLKQKIKENLVLFSKDKIMKKIYLNNYSNFDNYFELQSSNGKTLFNQIFKFDEVVFDNPKPIELIKFLIFNFKKNSIILDFFAGSGTTGHAVMELNREDGGNRKFILCTNNEISDTCPNGIAVDVTYERLFRIINGKTTNGDADFKWLDKNEPYENTSLRVIEIDDSKKISFDERNAKKHVDESIKGIKLLDSKYGEGPFSGNELDVWYDLNALNPLENEKEYKDRLDRISIRNEEE